MGFPPILNGKNQHLPPDHKHICPRCGGEFNTFKLVNESTMHNNQLVTIKKCPFCGNKFGAENEIRCKNCKRKFSTDLFECPYCGETRDI